MKNFLLGTFLTFLLLFPYFIKAQNKNEPQLHINSILNGKIIDQRTKLPIEGATIQIKGITHSVLSDKKGEFSFKTGQTLPYTLIISYVGYDTVEVVAEKSPLVVKLNESANQLNDIVVVGYGTQKKIAIVGSIATVKADETKSIPVASLDAQLQGKAAGVQINSQSGTPGEGVRIRVRGSTSINASNDPLYIVDGVFINSNSLANADATTASGKAGPMNLGQKQTSAIADISPSDIESIQVLKDAEATAIYGSRGANGVVIITTKHSNREGKAKVVANVSEGFAKVQKGKLWDVATGEEYATIVNETWINSGIDKPSLSQTEENVPFQRAPDGSWYPGNNTYRGNPSDQQSYTPIRLNQVFRTGSLHSYDLAVLGGSKITNYYVGASYNKQDATIKPADFSRISLKANLKSKISESVSLGLNNLFSRTYRNQLRDGNGPEAGIFQSALQTPTYLPVSDSSGNPLRWASFDNTEVLVNNPAQWTSSLRYIGNVYLDIQLLPNLLFHSSFGIDYNNYRESEYYNTKTLIGSSTQGEAKNNLIHNSSWVNEQTLSFNNTLGDKGNISFLIGNTLQKNQWDANYLAGTGFPSDAYKLISSASNITGGQDESKNSLASFFSRVSYNYDRKYYLEATARADGSSKFGRNHKWGYFPAIGASWVVKNEEFLHDFDGISTLKLRASYGITGNSNGINDYASQGLWTGSASYPNSPSSGDYAGTAPLQLANPDLKWENTAQFNLGVDMGLYNDRINLTLDLYSKLTNNALLNLPVPSSTGYTSQLSNAGRISNKGYELGISTINIKTKDFEWTTNFNISGNYNKILRLETPITFYSRDWLIDAEGHPMYSFWLYKQLYVDSKTGNAVFQTADGKTSYSDTYNPNVTLTNDDRVIMGNAMPDFFGGITNNINYKRFDFNLFVSYQYGNDIINYNRFLGNKQGQAPTFANRFITKDQLNRWTTPGQITDVPRVTSVGNNYLVEQNSRFLEDGSFIRLKSLTIGYTFPESVTTKIKLDKVRFYIQGTNLLLLTKYSGPDPEISVSQGYNGNAPGLDQGTPPQPRSIQFGLNVTF
ncbi:TonB-linked outer membrane protein, SusC/RagA family [Arachidicoccus rhizosphaerae]|uniref:TonB-linked outer membrane protein, SusC/RagA family n=1 Tax=Arachidicoccus rhizosphaerae TaxID=551991 RepID=A0A1H3XUW8_9BACT|nr:TonB-dependent receptor [Arachidicoccus rhizosphaerae]SEA02404.1 TonB-linked outer membrane protein, SusC/RagA family [Arachidicoccus rhizosphaerae]